MQESRAVYGLVEAPVVKLLAAGGPRDQATPEPGVVEPRLTAAAEVRVEGPGAGGPALARGTF